MSSVVAALLITLGGLLGIAGRTAHAQSARAIPDRFPITGAFGELDTLINRLGPAVGVTRKEMKSAIIRLLRQPDPMGRAAWSDGEARVPAHVAREAGVLHLRVRRGGVDGVDMELRMDVTGLRAETRARLAVRLAAAMREMRKARAFPVEGTLVVSLSEMPARGQAVVGGEARGIPEFTFRTANSLGCAMTLDSDFGRVGDTLVLAAYGTPRYVTLCESTYTPAVGARYRLPSEPGLYELRIQWNGGEDRYRVSIGDSVVRTDVVSGSVSRLEGVPRWRYIPHTLVIECTAEGSPATLCANLFRAFDDALGSPVDVYGGGLIVPFDESGAIEPAQRRIYGLASAEARARACAVLSGYWRALVRPSRSVAVTLIDGSGVYLGLRGGENEQNEWLLGRCKTTSG